MELVKYLGRKFILALIFLLFLVLGILLLKWLNLEIQIYITFVSGIGTLYGSFCTVNSVNNKQYLNYQAKNPKVEP